MLVSFKLGPDTITCCKSCSKPSSSAKRLESPLPWMAISMVAALLMDPSLMLGARCGPAPEAPASVGRASAPAQAERKRRRAAEVASRGAEGSAPARMEDPAPEMQQLRSLRDFLLVYNRMTELCFQRCVADLNYRALTRHEEACLDGCAGKLVRSNHRLMAAYVQLMPSLVQRRIADYEAAGRDPAAPAALPGSEAP